MPPRRRITVPDGLAAIHEWAASPETATRDVIATAVRFTLEELSTRHPGHSTEVRVPPFGVTQCLEGTVHRRGTPPCVVETTPQVWLKLVVGTHTWDDAVAHGEVVASGMRTDVGSLLPLWDPTRGKAPPTAAGGASAE